MSIVLDGLMRGLNCSNSFPLSAKSSSSQSAVPRLAAEASPGNLLEMQVLGS